MAKEHTLKFGKANLYAFLISIPIGLILLILYSFIWSYEDYVSGLDILADYFYVFFAGIIIHEFLHIIGWAFFTSKGFKSFRIGIKLKYITLYCHVKEPLKVKHYRAGIALPLIILGIIPSLYGIFTGNGTVFSFGLLFTLMAGGDIIVLMWLRNLDNNSYIIDHSDKMGFTEL
jgi:hypothetical protein